MRTPATLLIMLTLCCAVANARPAAAQGAQPSQASTSTATWRAEVQELVGGNHWRFFKDVAIEQGDTKLFADQAELFGDEDRVVASGNVTVSQTADGLTISADRVEFNLRTRTGTFHNARGSATIKPRAQVTSGGFAPPSSNEPTDVYFFGERLEKTGARSYRISNGGFTTCVQPTPRWDLHANTVELKVDDYTLLRNAVFKVKNVPLFYLPILYYPTKEEDRSTGFLLPTYSSSDLRGQGISNAFFWAINRSHDAKFTHDWYSKTGQGYGSEYRYNLGVGDGSLKGFLLDERPATYAVAGGSVVSAKRRSFDLRGAASHTLPFGLRARGQVDYSSDIIAMQSYYTNVNDFTRNSRRLGGNLVGAWGSYSLNAVVDHTETFYDASSSVVYGNTPRVSVTRSERPLFGAGPVYFSMTSEYAGIARESRTDGVAFNDSGLTRFDIAPQVSVPFRRWQWLSVNSTMSWRDTFYSRSRVVEGAGAGQIVDDNLNRRYFTLAARIVGPVFNRVWDNPGGGYAERFKHTVEPFLNVSRTSSIDDYDRIVQTDGIDAVVGNASNFTYGINNRFYAKRPAGPGGQASQAQEIVSVALSQTYYSDERSAQFDQQYSTSGGGAPPSHFSPIFLNVNATPSTNFNGSLRAEIDGRYRQLRTMSVGANYSWTGLVSTGAGWNKRFLIEELPGFDNPDFQNHTLNLSTNVRTRDSRFGGTYALTYDIFRSFLVTQSVQAYYNAQCCGVALQFLQSGYPSTVAIPNNRTFFVSFTLAGLGNFSPFSGALGAIPR